MKFEGTAEYVATPDLNVAVNAAIALERPLLVKGEPGTGKTELARQVAASLGLMHRTLARLGLTLKKSHSGPRSRSGPSSPSSGPSGGPDRIG